MRFLILLVLTVFPTAAFSADLAWQVYEGWPFDSAEAAKRQADTAKSSGATDPLKLPLGDDKAPTINWRLIPPGKFIMGSPATEPGHEGDEPLKEETVPDPFYVMDTQLTLAAYRALMQADPPGTPADADGKLPAAVTYRDAVDKVMPALGKLAPKGWKIILIDRVRLEYAARAGVATMNPGGDKEKDADDYAWTQSNSGKTVHPVGQKKPNAWGLYDVLGNRWHWYWAGPGGNGDGSHENHLVYGGTYKTPASGNGARLANIMVSGTPEGVRYALLREETELPKGHPKVAGK